MVRTEENRRIYMTKEQYSDRKTAILFLVKEDGKWIPDLNGYESYFWSTICKRAGYVEAGELILPSLPEQKIEDYVAAYRLLFDESKKDICSILDEFSISLKVELKKPLGDLGDGYYQKTVKKGLKKADFDKDGLIYTIDEFNDVEILQDIFWSFYPYCATEEEFDEAGYRVTYEFKKK